MAGAAIFLVSLNLRLGLAALAAGRSACSSSRALTSAWVKRKNVDEPAVARRPERAKSRRA